MNSRPNCFTIPAGKPFLPLLARWLLERYGASPGLSGVLVLLPNQRSCRSLREAFLDITGGKPLLLPRIQPVGDVEENVSIHYEMVKAAIPPAMPQVCREFMLAKLVMDFKERQSEMALGRVFNIEQAAQLARQLARFMDEAARFGAGFERLPQLVPDELAVHWQQTLDFLSIVSRAWPDILRQEGMIDPIDHRNRLLQATAQEWLAHPPSSPVVAAGSTGSSPATAALLSAIARLPQGRVVLPGLDTDMDASEWKTIGETHPQFGLKQLLETMGCERAVVQPLPGMGTGTTPRLQCLRAVLQAPEATSGWSKLSLPLEEGLKELDLLVAETLHDEARMIAVALREALQTPGRTAALVTPDRTLARMVASQMQRFGIEMDDSAGHPLADTPAASFLRLLADMVANEAAPASLLALLRHPLAAAGRDTAECRALSRALEVELLRGLRRAPGLAVLKGATKQAGLKSMLAAMEEHLRPLSACFEQRCVSLQALLEAHIACAEWLAGTHEEPGAARLWVGEAGNRLAELLAEFLANAGQLPDIDPATYPGLFDVLLAGHSYYPRFGLHPRLHILSPMEARLQQFDKVILGSLNEGTWPAPSEIDPWMSRPMRKAFRLPPLERAIGQSAHDFYMLCAGGEVLLTRAQKVDGTPTIPSRWLVRLETLAGGLDKARFEHMQVDAYYNEAKARLDRPQPMEALARPEPKPPLAARPRKLRVTAVDNWLADPYRVYAYYILQLRELPELDQDPDAADFGELVHKAMERFATAWPEALPENPLEKLIECGRAAFADMLAFPAVASLWWPRFEAIAEWVVAEEIARRGTIGKVMSEVNGQWNLQVDGKPFILTTRIDRLEIRKDGTMALVDYKTGSVPTPSDIEQGRKNQLLLEALVAEQGQLQPPLANPMAVSGLEYWKLTGAGLQRTEAAVAQVPAALERLENLIRRYDNGNMPYAAPVNTSAQNEAYNSYAHLTRRQEWGEA